MSSGRVGALLLQLRSIEPEDKVRGDRPILYNQNFTSVLFKFNTFQVPKSQTTKTMAKSVNPHYNANLYFLGVTCDILLHSTIHLAVLGKY